MMIKVLLAALTLMAPAAAAADRDSLTANRDSLTADRDSLTADRDSLTADRDSLTADAVYGAIIDSLEQEKRRLTAWRPRPQRALWMALVVPGGGQIYNRKFWKLPIIYGGFIGCVYAMRWNNMMYKDYSQAYIDIMDSDPATDSYNKFLHLGRVITSSNEERYKELFRKRKDKYRRWRDMSFFVLVGVYALSVIDAYVDAELSAFDISRDLSMTLSPEITDGGGAASRGRTSVGLSLALTF